MNTEFIKTLKEQIPIADVVGEYVRLKKTGTNLMGLCPFHNERSPSFSVAPGKGIFHCFGCQKSGDVISFVQEVQAIPFHDAIRMLAEKYGINLPTEFRRRGNAGPAAAGGQTAEKKNDILYRLNHFTATFYNQCLMSPQGKRAREYLLSRGITEETMKKELLGFAPDEWSSLTDFLAEKKAPVEAAEALGLIKKRSDAANVKDGRAHYDFFRNRVLFPVTDMRGRVIAFGGRKMGDEEGPKYLNSTESPIFKKGNGFYGIFRAQKDIRAENVVVVVEGFMDCLSLQQAGFPNAVATLGTALGAPQIQILKRLADEIVLVFDGDEAGKQAEMRGMEACLAEGVVAKGVRLADEYDPDEFIQEKGLEAFQELVKKAPYLLDQRILEFATESGAHPEGKARAVDQILPWLQKLNSETAKFMRAQQVASLFGVEIGWLEQRLGLQRTAAQKVGDQRIAPRRVSPMKSKGGFDKSETKFIEILLSQPVAVKEITDDATVLEGIENLEIRELARRFIEQARAIGKFDADALELAKTPEIRAICARALVTEAGPQGKEKASPNSEEIVQEFKDLSAKLVRRGMERRRDSLRAIILKAEGAGQSTELARLMGEYNELVKRLEHRPT